MKKGAHEYIKSGGGRFDLVREGALSAAVRSERAEGGKVTRKGGKKGGKMRLGKRNTNGGSWGRAC